MRSTKIKVGVACVAGQPARGAADGGGDRRRNRRDRGAGRLGQAHPRRSRICGKGTGKKATGTPIKLGGINMLIPGVDFTTISKIANAYFQCVNDNGGINGRPIRYIQYTEQLNPAQEAALARKLIEQDKVVGVVGNTSFAECGTNWKYYQQQGLRGHRRGRAGRVLQHAVLRRGEHGPALQQRRRCAGARQGRHQEARHRLAGHDLGVRGRRRGPGCQEGRHPGTRSSRPTCRSRTRPRS